MIEASSPRRHQILSLLHGSSDSTDVRADILCKEGVLNIGVSRTLVFELPKPKTLFVWVGEQLIDKTSRVVADRKGSNEIKRFIRERVDFKSPKGLRFLDTEALDRMGLEVGKISPYDFLQVFPEDHGYERGFIVFSDIASDQIAGRLTNADIVIPIDKDLEVIPNKQLLDDLIPRIPAGWTMVV